MVVTPPAAAPTSVTAFAPATVSNLCAGFDVLGFAMGQVGDRVSLERCPPEGGLRISGITGVVRNLPHDPARNTATVALRAMLDEHPVPFGFEIDIDKGIPLGSGMGGSAASAVAAVVAANEFLDRPLSPKELLPYAVAGEGAASGASHADNAAPALFGGLTAVVGADPLEVVNLPVPRGLRYVVVHPELEIETRRARAALAPAIPLATHVRQSMHLAGFISACHTGDLDLLSRSLVDLVAQPVRAGLIPGYHEARADAIANEALGFGIAGAGPSVFALVGPPSLEGPDRAPLISDAIVAAFASQGVGAESWIGTVQPDGAVVEGRDAP